MGSLLPLEKHWVQTILSLRNQGVLGMYVPHKQFIDQFNNFTFYLEMNMAHKKGTSVKTNINWQDIQFVDFRLSGDMQLSFEEWHENAGIDVVVELFDLVGMGYKLSVTYDLANNCYIVSLTCRDENSVNFMKCMSGRADEPEQAIAVLVFKHMVVCGGDWSKAPRSVQNFG